MRMIMKGVAGVVVLLIGGYVFDNDFRVLGVFLVIAGIVIIIVADRGLDWS